jgi:hypothetical protein
VRRNEFRALLVVPRRAPGGWPLARLAPGFLQRMSIRFVERQRAATG